jgi:hypothetical protein
MTLLDYYEAKRPKNYETSWHHRFMCRVLEQAYTERKNFIIEAPPRHGKSELANVYGPSWWIEGHPFAMFGLVCNGDSLGKKFSAATRNLCTHPLEIDRDSAWKVKGLPSLNYSYMSTGIRGSISGHGFETVNFDDVLKNASEFLSETVRENVWENVISAAINRLTPDGIIGGLQARGHSQDTIGRLLELDHLKFLHLHLPATNDSGTEAWYSDGYSGERIEFPAYEALWPSRYSREKLDEIKATISSRWWQGQYQASPSLGDDTYFDLTKCPRHENAANMSAWWMAVDAAQTATASGSRTAFVAVGFDQGAGRLKVLGASAGRWKVDQMGDEMEIFGHSMMRMTGMRPLALIIERAAGGYALIDRYQSRWPVSPVTPLGSKEERAGGVCHLVNQGRVSLPTAAPWLKEFESEVSGFPLAAFSDLTDAFVHCLSLAARPSEFKHWQEQEGLVEYEPQDDTVFEMDGWEEPGGPRCLT